MIVRARKRALAVLVLGAASLAATSARAESLAEALVSVYESNPTVQAARARLRGTNEQVPQALSNWRPDVRVSGSAGVQRLREEQPSFGGGVSTTTEDTTPLTASVRLSQSIYRGGQNFALLGRAKNLVLAQRAELQNTTQETFLEGIQAYLDVWRDREIVRLSRNNVEDLEQRLEATQARLDRGIATQTDLQQARSRLSQARARLETSRGQLTESRARYQEVVGHVPQDLSFPGPPEKLPSSEQAAVNQALESNPRVRAAEFNVRAADRRVRQAEGALLPSLSLQAAYSHQQERAGEDRQVDRAEVTLNLEIPLYQAGQATSEVRQAKQRASERRSERAQAQKAARQSAISAWGQLEAARAERAEIETQVEAAQAALAGVEEELRVGARTVLDLLDAEQELFVARVERVRARRDLVLAGYQVLAATGQLTAQALDLPTDYYDPRDAYNAVSDTWWRLDAPEAGFDTGEGNGAAGAANGSGEGDAQQEGAQTEDAQTEDAQQ